MQRPLARLRQSAVTWREGSGLCAGAFVAYCRPAFEVEFVMATIYFPWRAVSPSEASTVCRITVSSAIALNSPRVLINHSLPENERR